MSATTATTKRRALSFASLAAVMPEVDRLLQGHRTVGNWTLGQTLGHVACWVEYNYTGAPLKVPFFIRWLCRLRKQKFLYEPMRPGLKIPGVQGGTLGTEPMSLEEGLGRLRRVMERLKVEAPTTPNLAFGPLTHEEWIAGNLRHAEMHLGFLVPE